MTPTLESIQQGLKNGLKLTQIAEQHNINYKTFYYYVLKFGGAENIKNGFDSPQVKAHQTMRKNAFIEKYNTATSSGIKASVARKYKKTFGNTIKAELSKVKAPKVVAPKVDKKVAFKEKEVQFMLPTKIKEMFNELHQKIHTLELTIDELHQKIHTLELTIEKMAKK
jgi:hypothetical protein